MGAIIQPGSRNTAIYQEGRRVAAQLMEDERGDVLEGMIEALKRFNEENCVPPKDRGEIYDIAYRCMKDAAKEKGDEAEVKKDALLRLAPHFIVHEEAWGTHWSGKRVRIDAIVRPRDDSEWKTKAPKLGIEFKNFRGFNPSFDMKDYTRWWAQCHDYAETDFDGHGRVYVFAYNGFVHYHQRTGDSHASALAVRFWGRLGVGEIDPADMMFVINGTNKIWSLSRGVIDGRRMSMERKFGSR